MTGRVNPAGCDGRIMFISLLVGLFNHRPRNWRGFIASRKITFLFRGELDKWERYRLGVISTLISTEKGRKRGNSFTPLFYLAIRAFSVSCGSLW